MTEEQIKSVMSNEHTESTEQTYDIYLLPPGEDPETCQSYLRMRNKDGKYNLMFEVCFQYLLHVAFSLHYFANFTLSISQHTHTCINVYQECFTMMPEYRVLNTLHQML